MHKSFNMNETEQLRREIDELRTRLDSFNDYSTLSYEYINAIKRIFPNFIFASDTLDFGNLVNNGSAESKTIKVSGATPGDVVILGLPSGTGDNFHLFTTFVSATDVVTISLSNTHPTNAFNPPSGVYTVIVIKKP